MRAFVTILAALSLSGCAALPAISGLTTIANGIAANSSTLQLTGTTALTIAADAYTGASTLVEAAVRHGAFTDDQLRMIRTLNNQALDLIKGTDAALTVEQRAASLTLIVTQLHSILGN